jgi:serpin B
MKNILSRWWIAVLAIVVGGGWNSIGWADSTTDAQDVDAVADGNNAFGAQLLGHLSRTGSGNLFFSPFSINSALAMTYNGARGQTATQMGHVLHSTLGASRMNAAFAAISSELADNSMAGGEQVYDVSLANAIWAQDGFAISNDFIQAVEQNFGAKVQQADFTNPAQVADDINNWVSDKTADNIQNLISPDALTPRTRLVLVNAIYFKGNWANAFDASMTVDESFHLNATSKVTVAMMNQEETISYMEDNQLQIAEFPYVGNNLSMVVLLPRAGHGLGVVQNGLMAGKLNQWLGKMSPMDVMASLPKFKLQSQFELAAALSGMGMSTAFSRRADFSGISTAAPLQISRVIHKAIVDVNETGTTAAAATGMVISIAAAMLNPPWVVFRADHPFIFLIRDRVSGAILFMGRVTNPSDN